MRRAGAGAGLTIVTATLHPIELSNVVYRVSYAFPSHGEWWGRGGADISILECRVDDIWRRGGEQDVHLPAGDGGVDRDHGGWVGTGDKDFVEAV